MIGTSRVAGTACKRRQTSKPSMPGITASRRIRSGSRAGRARAPSPVDGHGEAPGLPRESLREQPQLLGSSSTSRTSAGRAVAMIEHMRTRRLPRQARRWQRAVRSLAPSRARGRGRLDPWRTRARQSFSSTTILGALRPRPAPARDGVCRRGSRVPARLPRSRRCAAARLRGRRSAHARRRRPRAARRARAARVPVAAGLLDRPRRRPEHRARDEGRRHRFPLQALRGHRSARGDQSAPSPASARSARRGRPARPCERASEELTPREREVCLRVAQGRLNKQIAAELGAAEKTIKVHRGRVMEKLGMESVAELVRFVDRLQDT